MDKEKEKFSNYQTTLVKAYDNIHDNIDSLLLSSNHYDKMPDAKFDEQLKNLKRLYQDFFHPLPKKVIK